RRGAGEASLREGRPDCRRRSHSYKTRMTPVTTPTDRSWTEHSDALDGPDFVRFHTALAEYNGAQIEPGFPSQAWREDLEKLAWVMRAEGEYVEAARNAVAPHLADIPTDVDGFIAWFEDLRETGPGQ